ncbi:hypothetical protein ACIQAA_16265 [Neobacillus sp. NPDC093182]|uniref:hypothetical protein n=1 Tax=Neobacillus sp. NPDC093182 TaxID=3364297 RepID=UPI0038265299
MIHKNAMDLTNSIKKYRQDMDQLMKIKDISHPDVIKLLSTIRKENYVVKKV